MIPDGQYLLGGGASAIVETHGLPRAGQLAPLRSRDGVRGGASGTLNTPAYYRYDGPWVGGEKQKIINVVPKTSVTLSPSIAVVPLSAGGQKKEFRVSVLNDAPEPSEVAVSLEVPAGWTVDPASATLKFSVEEEEMSAQFFVTPPARVTRAERHPPCLALDCPPA